MAKEPLIQALEIKIQSVSDEILRAEYTAEMACYWARSGNFSRAEEICRDLRASYGDGNYPRISVLIMCVEGLLLFFRDVNSDALDRLSRAFLLSKALGLRDIAAFSAAWIAHINFNFDRYPQMCSSLKDCFECLEPENVAARGRAAIVLADAFLLCGDNEKSKRWFQIARNAAAQSGDHTLVASLTYNRAALNAYLTQLKILQGEAPPSSLDIVASEVGSAIGYQRIAELQSLEQLLHLAMIGLHIFRQDFDSGWSAAKTVYEMYDKILLPRQRALLVAQKCLCAVMTRREAKEVEFICRGEEIEGLQACDAGDKALIADCCAKVAARLGMVEREAAYKGEMKVYLIELEASISDLRLQIEQFSNVCL